MTNKISKNIINLTIKKAKTSQCYKHHIGATIFNKTRVISTACNNPISYPKSFYPKFYGRNLRNTHAELMAIINANSQLHNSSILVVRVNRNGEMLLAKPCQNCMKYIVHVGIKKLYYSISKSPHIVELKLNNLS